MCKDYFVVAALILNSNALRCIVRIQINIASDSGDIPFIPAGKQMNAFIGGVLHLQVRDFQPFYGLNPQAGQGLEPPVDDSSPNPATCICENRFPSAALDDDRVTIESGTR